MKKSNVYQERKDACTAFIIGKKLSKTNKYMFGRSEDLEVNHNKVYKIHKTGEHKQGDVFVDVAYDQEYGFRFVYPHDSYAYSSVSDTTVEFGEFDEAGFNEMGLAVDMTVSACSNEKILEVDPYIISGDESHCAGISEASIASVLLASCKNAFEAITTVANIMVHSGSSEGNTFVVADEKEVWYMELYSGHQFVAMKYPEDCFSVMPNTFWINEISLNGNEYEDYFYNEERGILYSKKLKEVALVAGTYVGSEDVMNVSQSYNPPYKDSNRSRATSGIKHFNKDANVSLESAVYPFLQSVDHLISLEDCMAFTRNRLENIGLVANDVDGADILYPIGNRNALESHVFVMDGDKSVMYLALGSPLVSPYVPYYPMQEKAIEEVQVEANSYAMNSMYWVVMDVLHMVEVNREAFMEVVLKYRKDVLNGTKESQLLDAKNAFLQVKYMQEELKPMYEDYLLNHEHRVSLKTTNEVFQGVTLVQKGLNKHYHLVLKDNVLEVVDCYNKKEDVKVTIELSYDAFAALEKKDLFVTYKLLGE